MGAARQTLDLVAQEQKRFMQVCRIIDLSAVGRHATLLQHDSRAWELLQERLYVVYWRPLAKGLTA